MRVRDWFKWTGMMTLLYATFFLFASCSANADSHRVIVKLRAPTMERMGAVRTHQIRRAQMGVKRHMRGHEYTINREYKSLPYIAMTVDDAGLLRLSESRQVLDVAPDVEFETQLQQSVPLVGADVQHRRGVTGKGYAVAIIDTGVDGKHPALAGKVIAESCFTNGQCPNGQSTMIGPGAAVPVASHGTHVAGICCGNAGVVVGVAPGASVVASQVFTLRSNGGYSASFSDIVASIEHIATLADGGMKIVSLNMSLGTSAIVGKCDSSYQAMFDAAELARAQGVAVIAASGNNGSLTGVSSPGCISNHVAIGCTTKADAVCSFSNRGPEMELWAPGQFIASSVPGGGLRSLSGTSMSAPHVAGAYALFRQMFPAVLHPDHFRSLLWMSGIPIDGKSRMYLADIAAPIPPDPNQPRECPTVCPDSDGDGEYDSRDRCALTATGEAIDEAGCSHTQFCASVKPSSWRDRMDCRRLDWGNDEPRRPRDCKVVRRAGVRECVPR